MYVFDISIIRVLSQDIHIVSMYLDLNEFVEWQLRQW